MKKIAILSFAMALLFTACSDKDSCESADWVGTYSGSFDCLDNQQTVSIVIEEGDEENTINVTTDGETDVVELSGCSISMMDSAGGFGESTTTLTLDGNSIKYSTEGNLLGIPFNCTGTLTK